MSEERNTWRHRQWIQEIKPTGLVVTPPTLNRFGLVLSVNVNAEQQTFREQTLQKKTYRDGPETYQLENFPRFAQSLLEWDLEDLAGCSEGTSLAERFKVYLQDVQVHLQPTYALMDPDEPDGAAALLVTLEEEGTNLDRVAEHPDSNWRISPLHRFLRLLRATGQSTGLLCNGRFLRLVYAPEGEAPGYMDFPVDEMTRPAGRNMFAALLMLLNDDRLIRVGSQKNLTALLAESRKYQNEVSEQLAAQVQVALDALLEGFQAACPTLIDHDNRHDTEHIYGGLLNVMMRLVFILYAEDHHLMPASVTYRDGYGLVGLFERLREAQTRYPDTMDQRFGAWSQLLALFRLIYRGGGNETCTFSPRYGELFNPDAFPFLEGRTRNGGAFSDTQQINPPAVSDGTVLKVLENLLVLDGERLSYRGLNVETIGSVYEAMMGYEIEQAKGPSLTLGRFSVVVDLNQMLGAKDRKKWLKAQANLDLSKALATAVKKAASLKELEEVLQPKVSKRRPHLIQVGGLYLQPGEERRKTGSHYTPPELTGPIVRHTLDPLMARFGEHPTPDQVLSLKVCDPAMGSGAFLVEVCRYLAEHLVTAWNYHMVQLILPPDEDPLTHARRLVAGRCLYGIDKNPFAVGLAKLSLWLVTMAKDHPFTFLDHALRCGDTLLGLTQEQIRGFHWLPEKETYYMDLVGAIERATSARHQIHALGDGNHAQKRELYQRAENELDHPRLAGNLLLTAFFAHKKAKDRESDRTVFLDKIEDFERGRAHRQDIDALCELLHKENPQLPFHIELEFPEVFEGGNPGFDAFVGNPPFCGGSKISSNFGDSYLAWVLHLHTGAHGNGDLVAHFFRRAFNLLRRGGTLGLIATNTIGQGDTRNTGLTWICQNGGTIYRANRRFRWPGAAAVVVSVVHVENGGESLKGSLLDGEAVPSISAFLVSGSKHNDPNRLNSRKGKCFLGVKIYGSGFTFDDTDKKGIASPISEMELLLEKNPRNKEVIQPYIGGSEINSSPTHTHHRFVINFSEMSLERASLYPDLLKILEDKVKPGRDSMRRGKAKQVWWQWERTRPAMFERLSSLEKVITTSCHQPYWCLTIMESSLIFSHALMVFMFQEFSAFCILQSNFHEIWVRAFGSSMKDDLRYTSTDCFETFSFPPNWEKSTELEAVGKTYFEWRAQWMKNNNQGMTKTYSLFHNKEEEDHVDMNTLRALHRAMDQAVLNAYGWQDQVTLEYDFLLDYEEEEEEGSKRKKPWRYRWTDDVCDRVLGLLLDLNQQRADEEEAERTVVDVKKLKKSADEEFFKPWKTEHPDTSEDSPLFNL